MSAPTSPTGRPERLPYSREATSVLDQIAERALDDDYYLVRPGRYSRSRGVNTMATALMLGLFMMMVTISAVQYAQDRPSQSQTRQALLDDINRSEELQSQLQSQVSSLEADINAARGELEKTPEQLAAELATGATEVHGDGIRIIVDPAGDVTISDGELRALLNELWIGGAEAIAINDQRWGALTSLRTAGGAITINFTSVGAPYVIEAIGDADAIIARLEDSGEDGYWARRDSQDELTYELTRTDDLVLHAAPEHRTSITRATPITPISEEFTP